MVIGKVYATIALYTYAEGVAGVKGDTRAVAGDIKPDGTIATVATERGYACADSGGEDAKVEG